jgi:hypothetical protein
VLSALQAKGLTLSKEADRRTLLRRVTYDLIGLPPTPEELDAFLGDRSPTAYEKVVDRLLSDPRYGERWARHWLDPAGYADSEGILQEDLIRPNAWRYRDYVIRAFNSDKPYDQFLREQIAGDELYDYRKVERFTPEIEEALTATGFLRTAVDATRTDFNPHQFMEYQLRMLNDMETILATTVMGIPLQCARCHDHKYEPLSQRDYYRVQAAFAGAVRPDGPLLPSRLRQVVAAGTAEQKSAKENNERVDAAVKAVMTKLSDLRVEFRLKQLQERIAEVPEPEREPLMEAVRTRIDKRTAAQQAIIEEYKPIAEADVETLGKRFPDFKKANEELQSQRANEERNRLVLPEIRALYDQDATPPPTNVLLRGEWTHKGETVQPGVPAILEDGARPFVLPSLPKDSKTTGRRRALADWIARPDNPLTARVFVNRVWAHHFGIGIVATLDNFGRSGARPTNQTLLDWLAVAFVTGEGATPKRSWSIKAVQRLIVTSAAYRQSSAMRPEAAKVDAVNALLWRQRARRLEAEAIRDGILAVSGSLDGKMFGEPVATETRAGGDIVPVGEEKSGRRSIYLLVRRSEPVSVLNAFDSPVMETNCTRRTVSATPVQSLALMNSSFISSQAINFAKRLLKVNPPRDGAEPDPLTITRAYVLALSRTPTDREMRSAIPFVREQSARYGKIIKDAHAVAEKSYADFCQALLSSNEFVYID